LSMVLGAYTDYGLLIMGVILVLLALFLPQGVVGFVEEDLKARSQRGGRRSPAGGSV